MAVNFAAGASSAELEMRGDCDATVRQHRAQLKWDRKRKKMVHVDPVSTTSWQRRIHSTHYTWIDAIDGSLSFNFG